MRQLVGCCLLLMSGALSAQWLPEWLSAQATLARAQVPACPREQAEGLSLVLDQGQLQGRLARLSLDLTCSRSGASGAEGESDALSLLLTLPPIDFRVEELTLYLPRGVATGAAELRHRQQHLDILWQTASGDVRLALLPEQQGWRWQGELPGGVLAPEFGHSLTLSGGWQPGQELTLSAGGALPAPLSGHWQLRLAAIEGDAGWQLQPGSRLQIPRLGWQALELGTLELAPVGIQHLDGPWQARLSWQQGRWGEQALPEAGLIVETSDEDERRGSLTLELGPALRLRGNWHYDQGLALRVPEQSLPFAGLWQWLSGWLALPVGVEPAAGNLVLSLAAPDLLDETRPVTLGLALREGQLSYRDMQAEQVAARLGLQWRRGALQTVGSNGLTVALLDIGVPITDLSGAVQLRRGVPWLSGLTARALGGQLALSPMALTAAPSGEMHFSDISLEQILGYTAVSGLTGNGRLHGRLPFSFERGFSVTGGRAHSENGWISYQAGEDLLASGASNLTLGLTLGLLSDLRYDRLEAEISMAPDGEAVIESRLQGQAPVMGRMHPVNFNYHHEENLLQLLASLRFARDLSERLPVRLQGENQ
ncbi:intermembrane phospholipid transport protein YdbH family protein [Zobellella iuensis]|uniref:YdbH domain-containing protein n=1 Tax=Zobellella iuensis TaxID=2803811 RepID=A0ABS1QMY2_9GAMM|nr:YdbH domain-containing protein [Zobellella iuensis]MBL1376161.1 YdbH domain-containing protein [Zobellella iuensis]